MLNSRHHWPEVRPRFPLTSCLSSSSSVVQQAAPLPQRGAHHADAALLGHGHAGAEEQTHQVGRPLRRSGRRSKVDVDTTFSFSLPPPRRFGVRPLPKRQMILKLKEIHQYTHQLASSSDSEGEARRPPTQAAAFKEPRAPPVASPVKSNGAGEEAGEGAEPLSASQASNTSSVAASEESERYGGDLTKDPQRGSDTCRLFDKKYSESIKHTNAGPLPVLQHEIITNTI